MKKYTLSLITISTMFFAATSYAAAPKIAIIDLENVMQHAPQVKVVDAKLKKEFAPRDAKIKAAAQAMQKHVQILKRNASVMSSKEKSEAQGKLLKESEALQKSQGQFSQDLQTAQAQAMKKIFTKITAVVNSVAKKDGDDLVLQKSAAIYYKPSYDITSQVIAKLK